VLVLVRSPSPSTLLEISIDSTRPVFYWEEQLKKLFLRRIQLKTVSSRPRADDMIKREIKKPLSLSLISEFEGLDWDRRREVLRLRYVALF
jgi:hypothetical protein